ncbi:flippase-like domain-containing protein [Thermococcus sp. M39]|uniref:lysylphosphatidylglycerol synthase transmembrane domain-containing protein n=1 Tax=unclassified Thermococcus TaxID=2627626 RepID=UPI00143AAFE5|nr:MULTISPECIES: lysylphosphatidylglycerol synthase transmembrane domain-containing protein [unclassified Thermococcus]NJE08544.1 flippase-like domain-containing protein [Thermococcus sp. M39]NJE13142.1 flippase-like domain-containing protein [Thermococcus sp. LS2]
MDKKRVFTLIALLISLAYLYKNIDVDELKLALKTASHEYLLVAFMLSVLTVVLSSLRWYLFLREVQKTSFKKTLKAFISGYYLMTILPPSVGHIAKVKLVGGDYFKALSSLVIGLSTEILVVLSFALIFVGFTKLGVLGLILILVALIYEKGIYKALDSLLKLWESVGLKGLISTLRSYLERTYKGWSEAKENKAIFLLSFLLSAVIILLQVFGIIIVGKAFNLEISMRQALYGFLMSVLFASVSGIPAGFGANEFGLVLGIGASTKATITAFIYKFLFQYIYSIAGAVMFYGALSGGE